ncbi:GNAT family N-acetyltransferase [Vibrio sp. SS-MA-C1-2]|uniref:GNAT family N-acetyltransferase n=1 Tax=Vibrio sp. SS-MA-C1-2 TaxID=2908646 RepID=UPI001F440F06|nr:GNAT family protein [Vibrio sp. SS-MA-C1-2]UJF20035.1 GNAT family N-acetyltransferase [Vibrio sp. SS-MA-C1-2]
MFQTSVDDQIVLSLIDHQCAKPLSQLVIENYDHLVEWLAWPPFCQTEESYQTFISESLYQYADGKSLTCAIRYDGEIVGMISFNLIDHQLKKVEIGYWLAEKDQGKGIISRCCQFLIDYAFTVLDMEKVEISVAENNQASRAVCERLGFTLEGILTNHTCVNGIILNHAIYGLYRK